jgi:hypothetical protein
MFPIGTRVTVRSVDHLGGGKPPTKLIGRTGTVWGHENGMNLVTGLTALGGLRAQAFADQHVTPA